MVLKLIDRLLPWAHLRSQHCDYDDDYFWFWLCQLDDTAKGFMFFDDYGYDEATRDVLVLVLLASLASSVPTLAGPGLGGGIKAAI